MTYRPGTNNTPNRCVRIPDDVWNAAVANAADEGTTATAVVLAALVQYNRKADRKRTGAAA